MQLIREHPQIESLLDIHREALGDQFRTYRNHVYRIFNMLEWLTLHDLTEEQLEKFAVAAVFHDIGIWTERSMDYLETSEMRAREYLSDTGREAWADEVAAIIRWHHKVTAYTGKWQDSVELFRKADWIDVTRGFRSFGIPRQRIVHLYSEFPDAGFHRFLLERGVSWAIRHPLRPLPMFKR